MPKIVGMWRTSLSKDPKMQCGKFVRYLVRIEGITVGGRDKGLTWHTRVLGWKTMLGARPITYGQGFRHETANRIPSPTTFMAAALESGKLRDGEMPVEADVREETRAYAQQQVAEIRRTIFPLHGLA